jgi:FMN-dependent NADH-azoreductase
VPSPLNILEISSSARRDTAISRQLTGDLVAALRDRYNDVNITRRDIAEGLPFVDAAFARAKDTPPEQYTLDDQQAVVLSDELIAELKAADVVVIGAPMYNFTIPASLKAWIDLIARPRVTFRYTENGPEGLLQGKKAYVVVSSGGVPIGSPVDFATPYLKHALAFVGLTDVEFIGAAGADRGNQQAMDDARARIADLVHLQSEVA